jgi:hypothetical protein
VIELVIGAAVAAAYYWRFSIAGVCVRIRWHRLLLRPRLIPLLWRLWRG